MTHTSRSGRGGAGRFAPGKAAGQVDDAPGGAPGSGRGQRRRCPPPAPFAHLPTASHHRQINPGNTLAAVYNGSTRFASPISGRSRLIPDLETTVQSALPKMGAPNVASQGPRRDEQAGGLTRRVCMGARPRARLQAGATPARSCRRRQQCPLGAYLGDDGDASDRQADQRDGNPSEQRNRVAARHIHQESTRVPHTVDRGSNCRDHIHGKQPSADRREDDPYRESQPEPNAPLKRRAALRWFAMQRPFNGRGAVVSADSAAA